MNKHQHLEEIDRSLADIQVMGQVAIRAAQNLQLCEDDSGCYRLPEQETSILLFSVHDVLDRIGKLRANLEAGPDAGTVDEADIPEGGINKNQTRQPDTDFLYELRHMAILGIRVLEGMDEQFHLSHAESSEALAFCLHDMIERIDRLEHTAGRD
ncbi:hypothetical protein [Bradyrhizobium sp. CCBAU 53415]|uniref:hypothetical protein n=1 Tax=Bradyrhizobium sp. CCBAU 53415 TaxID=1325119 RepID=UPI00230602F0|nr:hypothetical protein [Bradyrhizobium sp. CCBAU 53415]MDA9469639.1 hypothetical protein [Bradyrhizobium sp. CCBAU 53415]